MIIHTMLQISILTIIHETGIFQKWYIIAGRLPMVAQKVTAMLPAIHSGIFLRESHFVISFQKRTIQSVAQKESQKLGLYTSASGSKIEKIKATKPRKDMLERFFPPIIARYDTIHIHSARRIGVSNPTRIL